jgi:predicted DsbA family dithiol-disulfide isomerase
MKEQKKMLIEIWSDVVCPFCYIGKRHLEKALSNAGLEGQVEIIWKSFLLNPELTTNPELSIEQYLSDSKGLSMSQVKSMTARVVEMATAAGLNYRLQDAVVANSVNAHRLLHFARKSGKAGEMKENLFRAYFCEAKNIDDEATLLAIAKDAGLDETDARKVISGNDFHRDVKSDYAEAQQLNISGVPFFVFNRKYAISGAQPVELFVQTLEKLASEGVLN